MNAKQHFAPAVVELLDSIQRGDKTTAKALIDSGVALNSHGNEGVTPLLWLITQRDQQAVGLALTLGADPNFPAMVEINRSGPKPAQPLALIAGNGDNRIFKLLLEHGANPNSIDQSTGHPAIFGCIDVDNWEQLNTLIEHKVHIWDIHPDLASLPAHPLRPAGRALDGVVSVVIKGRSENRPPRMVALASHPFEQRPDHPAASTGLGAAGR